MGRGLGGGLFKKGEVCRNFQTPVFTGVTFLKNAANVGAFFFFLHDLVEERFTLNKSVHNITKGMAGERRKKNIKAEGESNRRRTNERCRLRENTKG